MANERRSDQTGDERRPIETGRLGKLPLLKTSCLVDVTNPCAIPFLQP